MPAGRLVFAVVLVFVALAVQLTMLSRLPLPGATPDLVLLCVVALALVHGPEFGLVAGFVTGLAADLVPPADHAVGRWALTLTLVGYLAGLARLESRRSAFVPVAVVAVAAGLSVVLYTLTGDVVGGTAVSWGAAMRLVPSAVAYDVVLSAFVVPAVMVLADRFEPDPLVRR